MSNFLKCCSEKVPKKCSFGFVILFIKSCADAHFFVQKMKFALTKVLYEV